MECAYFGVPTVVLYRLSSPEYHLARRLVQVKHIAMPNLLAGETIFPEFIQHDATPGKLARAAFDFLDNPARCDSLRARLAKVMESLGGPGAARRAARAIVALLAQPSSPKPGNAE
jgi:lipid-A-disaccharide synthase